MTRTPNIEHDIELLARAACKAEIWSQDESLPIEDRADYFIVAERLRAANDALLAKYPHAMTLKPSPNTSKKPNPLFAALVLAAVCGAFWGIVLMALIHHFAGGM